MMARAASAKGEEVPWKEFRTSILRSKPSWAESIDDYLLFLSKKCGGVDGSEQFTEYGAFFRVFIDSSKRFLPGNVFDASAELPFTNLAYAVIKAAYTCPPRFVKHKLCNWIAEGQVKALGHWDKKKRGSDLPLCEKILRDCRNVFHDAGLGHLVVDSSSVLHLLTKVDCEMGRLVLDRQFSSDNAYQRPEQIAGLFFSELQINNKRIH